MKKFNIKEWQDKNLNKGKLKEGIGQLKPKDIAELNKSWKSIKKKMQELRDEVSKGIAVANKHEDKEMTDMFPEGVPDNLSSLFRANIDSVESTFQSFSRILSRIVTKDDGGHLSWPMFDKRMKAAWGKYWR